MFDIICLLLWKSLLGFLFKVVFVLFFSSISARSHRTLLPWQRCSASPPVWRQGGRSYRHRLTNRSVCCGTLRVHCCDTHTHTQFCIFIKFCWMLNFPFCVYYFNIKFLTRVFRFCLISNQPVQFITDQSADRFVLQRAIKLTYNVKSHAHFFWVMNSVYKKKKIYQHCLLKKILLADIIRLLFFVLNIIVNIW